MKKKLFNMAGTAAAVLAVILIIGSLYGCGGLGTFRDSDSKEQTDDEASDKSASDDGGTDSSETGESTEETTTEKAGGQETGNYRFKGNDEGFKISEKAYSLSSDLIPMGYSVDNAARDEYNRPTMLTGYQDTYGEKYNVQFVGGTDKTLYLTFTMGYEVRNDGVTNTERIMDILDEKKVPAIFFVDGGYTTIEAETCKKIVDRGYVLGCHGYDHPSKGIIGYSVDKQVEDGIKIYNAIYNITGVPPVYYRPGSGYISEQSLDILNELGFRTVMYSMYYYDYDTEKQPEPSEALNKLINTLHSGEILYLHTVSNTNVKILAEFIDKARALGYEFAMVP